MIGRKVTLRVRMGAGDAHYAGELVNGSRILDFWGDVGTELCIRRDGDESLFVSYDYVKFTAPVYSGDFMEYTGWIESEGKTSRKCKFEAHKYIELAKEDGKALSSANVLKEKVLCGEAEGTLIVKADLQRADEGGDPEFQPK